MAITQSRSDSNKRAQGYYKDTASSPALLAITLGFTPRYVAWHSLTGRISYEWFEGMAAGTTLKSVANGTRTLDTSDVAISVDAGSGNQTGGAGTWTETDRVITDDTSIQIVGSAPTAVVTIAAAAILQNEQIAWVAEA